ncbi:MAG: VWA domain-containing protein, partial [Thiotrichaceae bacterium]|nr:VWA domain-containing protein [Thiotrichaceae bacterium]
MLKFKSLLLILLCFNTLAHAKIDFDQLGGRVEAVMPDGDVFLFPTLKTDINVDIQGDLATITVQQTFENPLNTPLNVTYLFPINKDAAVYKMIMAVGDEIISAQIQKREEAQATFEQAKKEGKSAALLQQHRPNMFTQDIANLMPGLPIKVSLYYTQMLPKVDKAYELVIPLVVGPRFQPPQTNEKSEEPEIGKWNLPAYPPVKGLDIPETIDAERVAIQINLNGGMPIQQLDSQTHAIKVQTSSENQRIIHLAKNRVIDNQDFVLRYRLSGENNQAGLLSYYQEEQQGFFSLLIEPPAIPQAKQISPREMVFVLDCSGSMSGLPLNTSKAFMREVLQNLRPTDTFRIIRFSEMATEFSRHPLQATPTNIRRGIRYTDSLRGTGGTMMTEGVKQAFTV